MVNEFELVQVPILPVAVIVETIAYVNGFFAWKDGIGFDDPLPGLMARLAPRRSLWFDMEKTQ